MNNRWMSATAAMLMTAGWATAQAPALPAIDNADYARPGRPAVPAPVSPRGAAAPVASLAEANGAGPGQPSFGGLFAGPEYEAPRPYRVWASGDFLVWQIRSATLPSVASTVPFGVIRVTTVDQFLKRFAGGVDRLSVDVGQFSPAPALEAALGDASRT